MNTIETATLCYFKGRNKDAIGECYYMKALAFANTQDCDSIEDAQRLSLYGRFDHISELTFTPIKEKELIAKCIDLYMHYTKKPYPDLLPINNNGIIGTTDFSFSLDNDGKLYNLRAQLSDVMQLHVGYPDRTKIKISLNFGAHIQGYGWCPVKTKIDDISMSGNKSFEQLIKDIDNRIFKKQAESLKLARIEYEALIDKDKKTKALRNELCEHYEPSCPGSDKFYIDGLCVTAQSASLNVEVRQNYYHFATVPNLLKFIEVTKKYREAIEALTE